MSNANTNDSQISTRKQESAYDKLTKSYNSLKNSMFRVSAAPQNWTVAKDPKFGDEYFVINVGQGGAAHMNCLVLHRPIGQDYALDKDNSWCMSRTTDIQGFYETEKYPGAQKALGLISKMNQKLAIEAKLITVDESGTEYYPDGTNRQEITDLAREASILHGKMKKDGGRHFGDWVLYLKPEHANVEVKISNLGTGIRRYTEAVHDILMEYALHTTCLFDGTRQKEVPYLYGLPAQNVMSHLYSAFSQGLVKPVGKTRPSTFQGVGVYSTYSDYKSGDESMRQELVRLLKVYGVSTKEKNRALSEMEKNKDKAKKADLKAVVEAAELKEKESIRNVREKEKVEDYPTVSIIRKYRLSLDNATSINEHREIAAGLAKKLENSKD